MKKLNLCLASILALAIVPTAFGNPSDALKLKKDIVIDGFQYIVNNPSDNMGAFVYFAIDPATGTVEGPVLPGSMLEDQIKNGEKPNLCAIAIQYEVKSASKGDQMVAINKDHKIQWNYPKLTIPAGKFTYSLQNMISEGAPDGKEALWYSVVFGVNPQFSQDGIIMLGDAGISAKTSNPNVKASLEKINCMGAHSKETNALKILMSGMGKLLGPVTASSISNDEISSDQTSSGAASAQ